MIYFTLAEIALSVASALIYGSVFALFLIFARLLLIFVRRALPLIHSACFSYEKVSLRESIKGGLREVRASRAVCEAGTFLTVFLFGAGIILLSYYSLDGAVRIYTVLFSVLSARLAYKYAQIPITYLFEKALVIIILSLGIIVGVPISVLRRGIEKTLLWARAKITSLKAARKEKKAEKQKSKLKKKSNKTKNIKSDDRTAKKAT